MMEFLVKSGESGQNETFGNTGAATVRHVLSFLSGLVEACATPTGQTWHSFQEFIPSYGGGLHRFRPGAMLYQEKRAPGIQAIPSALSCFMEGAMCVGG